MAQACVRGRRVGRISVNQGGTAGLPVPFGMEVRRFWFMEPEGQNALEDAFRYWKGKMRQKTHSGTGKQQMPVQYPDRLLDERSCGQKSIPLAWVLEGHLRNFK